MSDSANPDRWVEEERHWYDLVRELDALGRIYYRRRPGARARKLGLFLTPEETAPPPELVSLRPA